MIQQFKENKDKVFDENGIELYTVRTDKFKTGSINIFFVDNLNKSNVTKNVLVSNLLKRGSNNLKSIKEINLKLEELYGAYFECSIIKKGEWQIMQFYIDYINTTYLNKNENIFDEILEFLFDIILNPYTKNSIFREDFFSGEKENIKRRIDSRINDKLGYSMDRCIEEMCKDEPYSIYEYGIKEDLDKLSEKDVFDYYKNYFIKQLPIKVFLSGEFDELNINKLILKLKNIKRDKIIKLNKPINSINIKKVREINEYFDVNQGKLAMGFRMDTDYFNDDYKSFVLYNSILGGGIHSKLFTNVREKESLAYYTGSRIDKYKSLQLITSGIDIDKKEKAYILIMKQIENMKNGEISDYEYNAAIKSIETSYNYLKDTQYSLIDFYLSQVLLNNDKKIDEIVNEIKTTKKEDIKKAAQKIYLDTIYFLKSK
ncbi:MAG: pitrilysin family protein [Clostridiales bacterium]